MSVLSMINLKKGYPIKKAILCFAWCTVLLAVLICIRDIISNTYVKDDLIFTPIFILFNLVTFFPLKKYVLTKNQAFPCLNEVLNSSQLEQLLVNETFDYVDTFKGTLLYKKIKESEHWLSVNGFYFYKPFVITCTMSVYKSIPYARYSTELFVMYLTGENVRIDTKIGHAGDDCDIFCTYVRNYMNWITTYLSVGSEDYKGRWKRIVDKDTRDVFDMMQDCSELRKQCQETFSPSELKMYQIIES